MSSFFQISPISVEELAVKIGATARWPNDIRTDLMLEKAGPIEDAEPGSLSFIDNPRYSKHLADTKACVVICSEKLVDKVPNNLIALVHAQPYKAYATALALLYPTANRPSPATDETGVSKHAFISDGVKFEDGVIVEAGAIIGKNASIGRNVHILANAVIGKDVQIGRGTTVGIGASVTNAYLGNDVVIHPGVRIGQDGFGFAMGPGGHQKVPQIGRVIIQDNVEIGANTTIDRGSNRDTVIGEGTKIDNLVQIGHNVSIGRHCVIVGLAGIAGSATLGDYVVVAGQAGVVGHITINDGAQIGGGSGVNFDVKAGDKLIGYPALPFKDWVRMNMILKSMVNDKKSKKETEN